MNFLKESNIRNKVTISIWDKLFEVLLWILFIIPGVVFLIKRNKTKQHLKELHNKIEKNKAFIENCLKERINILEELCSKDDKLAKFSFSEILANDDFSFKGQEVENIVFNVTNFFANPDGQIKMLLNQDANLKSQIIFIKDIYNNDVVKWNKEIFKWPVNKIVAAKENYTNELFYSVKYQEPIKIKGPFI